MKKFAVMVLVLIAIASNALAQDNITAITYQVSQPLGDFEKFIGETSWIGWGLEGRRYRSPTSKLTFGFAFAWNVFDEKTNETQVFDSGAVTGTQRRYVNSLPFLLTTDFYFNRKNSIKPFIGIGAGAYYIVQRLDIGVWKFEETNWHFGFAPEAGLQFPLGEIEGIFSLKYHYALKSGESVGGGEGQEYQYLSVSIGLAYARW